MTEKLSRHAIGADRWSYLWLAIAAIFTILSDGRWLIPLASWLAPAFMLRFVRTQKPVQGLVLASLACIMKFIVAYRGMIPAPSTFIFIIMCIILGLVTIIPFLADRLITPRLQGLMATLVFPLAWVTKEYLLSLGQYGTWGSVAYTQYGNLPLIQIVSITGLWGLSFVITWFASVINLIWEEKFLWVKLRNTVSAYAGVLIVVLLFGGIRLSISTIESQTVRVASITASPSVYSKFQEVYISGKSPPIKEAIEELESLTDEAINTGAKIVLWNEYAFLISKKDEEEFVKHGSELARQGEIYLLIAAGIRDPDQRGENKVFIIDPSGKVVLEYLKHNLVPVFETLYVIPGEAKIPMIDTPHGKIASVICFDMDFNRFIRQISGVDLLLAPSLDWKEIDPIHTQMASFRAIENGFSMIRCTGKGLSMAVDHQGRSLAAMDYFTSESRIMVSEVPMGSVSTVYSTAGDFFAWLCILGLLGVFILLFAQRKNV